jgi:hypothetical protein
VVFFDSMPRYRPFSYRCSLISRTATGLFISLCVVLVSACTGEGSADLSLRSSLPGETSGALTPRFLTAAYLPTDQNTADIYLSDIPAGDLADPSIDLTARTGNLVHIHLFLIPSAGMTPLASTACNITVRHLVLAGTIAPQKSDQSAGSIPEAPVAAVGLYGGAGFMGTSSEPGDDAFSGSLRDASVRLTRASPGFTDRLGPATMAGNFTAPRDEKLSRLMAARIEALSRNLAVR